MIPTWIVWSPAPPECREKVACVSMLDAARAWAERQFRKGMVARTGTEVLVRCENDPLPPRAPNASAALRATAITATTYQVKISIVNAPAFRASLVGVVHDSTRGDSSNGDRNGQP